MSQKCGTKYCFHGAFKDRDKAYAKATARRGAVILRTVKGDRRFIVITSKGRK